ncbi:MAG: hypothetical protein AAF927_27365 [Bacteroidota bacterium]
MKHTIFLLFFCLPLAGNAQSEPIADKLGYLPQWQFHNELEMQNWPKLLAGAEIEPSTLLLMTLPAVSASRMGIYQDRLTALYQELDKKKFASKSRLAQAKMLRKLLYKDFFKQYEYLAGLDKLFDEGSFNCLTASTLTALVMEHYQIPYQLKENDNVISIEIGEGEDRILMANEDGLGYTPDNGLMEGLFVTFLEKIKVVKEQERRLYDDRQLFHKYLMGRGTISFKELVGIHYFCQGYLAFAKEERQRAIGLLEKAFVFFPEGKRIAYWILNDRMLLYKLGNWKGPTVTEDFLATTNMLSLFSQAPELNTELFALGYEAIMRTFLFDRYQPEKAEQFQDYLLENLHEADSKEQAKLFFPTQMGIAHHNNQAYDKSFPYIIEANQNDPNFRVHKVLLLENARARFMNDPQSSEQNYQTYLAATTNDSVKRELRVVYLSVVLQEIALQANIADLEKALGVVEELYLLNPQVADYSFNYRYMLVNYANEGNDMEAYWQHVLAIQDSLLAQNQGEVIGPMLCLTGLLNIRELFRNNQLSAGVEFLTQFQEAVGKRFDLPTSEFDVFVGDAYWEYAAYYIRLVNYKKARAVLEEARPYMSDEGFIDEQINTVLIPLGG